MKRLNYIPELIVFRIPIGKTETIKRHIVNSFINKIDDWYVKCAGWCHDIERMSIGYGHGYAYQYHYFFHDEQLHKALAIDCRSWWSYLTSKPYTCFALLIGNFSNVDDFEKILDGDPWEEVDNSLLFTQNTSGLNHKSGPY